MGIDARFQSTHNVAEHRLRGSAQDPAAHQQRALSSLHIWYENDHGDGAGGLLVLPTGAGKTFTAMRHLGAGALSDGYKVLWLAHTHHLLEQAYDSLVHALPKIAEPRNELVARVVSGAPGHYRVPHVDTGDDFIFATLQTVQRALAKGQKNLRSFLDSADGKLFVVFDEAHHAPAASYRRLIDELRSQNPQLKLLGLTATPTYTDVNKRGWLSKLFPQGIIHQVSADALMKANILARPLFEEAPTKIDVEFEDKAYGRWLETNQDIPARIVEDLAKHRQRNELIANYYAENKERFGRTIIFADRIVQCEMIKELLVARGIKAEAVFSHENHARLGAKERSAYKRDHNAQVIERFKAAELDVLVNVRILSEGTDIPEVKTVFLTRQTTSRIAFNQMVGRALRGPAFGGSSDAFIITFVDQWKQLINFAGWDKLSGGYDETGSAVSERPPLTHLSIELIRRLAQQMDSGINVSPGPFLSLIPLGWYQLDYGLPVYHDKSTADDLEPVHRWVTVFDSEQQSYERLVKHLVDDGIVPAFEDPETPSEQLKGDVQRWRGMFFDASTKRYGAPLEDDIMAIARHVAQHGAGPTFFEFEQRETHDMDALAKRAIDENWVPRDEYPKLTKEYNRVDRFWGTLYHPFELFKTQFDACKNRQLRDPSMPGPIPTPELGEVPEELADEMRRQVKELDGFKCLSCGETTGRLLQVDHMLAFYHGGDNRLDNLQTLCRTCNHFKGDGESINFRDKHTDLKARPEQFPNPSVPKGELAANPEDWERYLTRVLNFFYRASAVHHVTIGKRREKFYHWEVELLVDHPLTWLTTHGEVLLKSIQDARSALGKAGPLSITFSCPGQESFVVGTGS